MADTDDLIPPGTRHQCNLPDPDALEDGTLARCRTRGCRRWNFKWTNYDHWVEHRWEPVRWYHFNLHRRIRKDQDDG